MTTRRLIAAVVLVIVGLVPVVGGTVLADDSGHTVEPALEPMEQATPWFCVTPPLSWVCIPPW